MTQFRHVAIATALLAGAGVANAQTTVITREPVQTQTIVTTTPPVFTPAQRQTIYRNIVREQVVPAEPTVEYRVGTRVPAGARLYAVPEAAVAEVPAIKRYQFMMVNGHVVLVDPATSEVVADVAD